VKLLVIDTATTANSIAISVDGRLVSECFANPEKTHSASLLAGLDRALCSAGYTVDSLDAIAVSLGPGSFTGLRVGIATVKGLALASGKKVVGISTLAMLAMNLPFATHQVCPMLDARKNEVYTALYRCTDLPELLVADCVVPPADFLKNIQEPTIFLGSGALRYRELITERLGAMALFAPAPCHEPRASAGAILAAVQVAAGAFIGLGELVPTYIRASEAELLLQRKELS
jgi:tRNA threonylcarbamoyladenosine biosynthesis protein TsaB